MCRRRFLWWEEVGAGAGFTQTATAGQATPQRTATRTPVDRTRTKARAGREGRPDGDPLRRRPQPRRLCTTPAVPWRRRSGAGEVFGYPILCPFCARCPRASPWLESATVKAAMERPPNLRPGIGRPFPRRAQCGLPQDDPCAKRLRPRFAAPSLAENRLRPPDSLQSGAVSIQFAWEYPARLPARVADASGCGFEPSLDCTSGSLGYFRAGGWISFPFLCNNG